MSQLSNLPECEGVGRGSGNRNLNGAFRRISVKSTFLVLARGSTCVGRGCVEWGWDPRESKCPWDINLENPHLPAPGCLQVGVFVNRTAGIAVRFPLTEPYRDCCRTLITKSRFKALRKNFCQMILIFSFMTAPVLFKLALCASTLLCTSVSIIVANVPSKFR